MKDYLVICKCREDQKFADRLRHDLKTAGLSVWVDVEQLKGDARHAVGFAEAIKSASSVLYIHSGHSAKSAMVKMELATAARASVPIILIVVDSVGDQAAPPSVADSKKIDFRSDYKGAFHSLIETLSGPVDTKAIMESGPSRPEGYLFLSYATEDTPYMEEVKKFLARRGYPYWEFQESARDYHTQLNLELEEVMRGAAATLSILSPEWKRSEWAIKEFSFSQQIGTPVILLRFKDLGPTLAISGIPYIDFVDDREHGFRKLDQELKQKGIVSSVEGSPRRRKD